VLVPAGVDELRVTATWGDYVPVEKDGTATGEWRRQHCTQTFAVPVPKKKGKPKPVPIEGSGGLQVLVSARAVRQDTLLRDLPAGTRAVSVFLVNRRPPAEPDDRKDIAFAFQVGLKVEAERPFVPRPNPRGRDGNDPDERIAELQYRDVMEYAVGHGISTRGVVSAGSCQCVETTWMPQAEVERVEAAAFSVVQLGMQALADTPDAPAIRQSLSGLVSGYRLWIATQRDGAPKKGPQGDVARDLLDAAGRAAERMEAGLALLDEPQVLDAFRLANRVMSESGRQRRAQERGVPPESIEPQEWRPFQLAFLLMNLRALASPTHAERGIVDLLFFPTGGGKTEAYLGLAAFAILLRRLRNPELSSAGVTVLMRYTLRLLTLDQLSRAATLVCALELARQSMPDRLGEWPFEIGLWVGKAATPNRMGKKGDTDPSTARAKTIAFRNNSRKASPIPLENCPWCGSTLKPDSFQLSPHADAPLDLRVFCLAPKCLFRNRNPLPVIAVDEPLYRRLPCFVIATIDKFASLPWEGASGGLLGGADTYDSAGFYGPWQPHTGQKLPSPLAPPDLIIQDELHLISGPLGTMAGLYETAIDELCARTVDGHEVRPKVIASTATVRRADAQVRALFGRQSVEVFPPPGPDRRDSFFAKTVALSKQPGRLYVGLSAQGRSLKVLLLRTYLAVLAAAQQAWVEAGGAKNRENPADPYMTLVGYFNSLRELGGSRRIVEDEVASRVAAYGDRKRVGEKSGSFTNREITREVSELTSRESTDRVSDTKRRLALDFTEKEKVDVALATNMISVGLDITRLGLMVVLGQPKAAAEYIQATSRVGRDRNKPGLVVTLLNVHRPRDRSHYERFEAFHASFYRSVEATSVTPFAPRALDRALPAIVVALGRHMLPAMTPPRGVQGIVEQRAALTAICEVLARRARAHRSLSQDEEARLDATLRKRASDLLDSWYKVGKAHREVASPLRYQRHEGQDGPALLHMPLDPILATLDKDARKFKAPRSLRDVEPAVDLWIKRLDGEVVEMAAEGEEA
jgi:hypothetical protein